jgi:hypothetical protein
VVAGYREPRRREAVEERPRLAELGRAGAVGDVAAGDDQVGPDRRDPRAQRLDRTRVVPPEVRVRDVD